MNSAMQMHNEGPEHVVVYSAANAHGYFTAIIHRMLFHHDAYAVYIGDKGTVSRAGGIELFDEHILYIQMGGQWGTMNTLSADEYEKYLTEYFDHELKQIGLELNNVYAVYTGSYWADFPIYLNIKRIKHYLFQEGTTSIGFPSMEYNEKNFPSQYTIQKKYGIYKYLDNENIIAAYLHPNNMEPVHRKKQKFDITEVIHELGDADKKRLIDTFHMPEAFDRDGNNILILTQWFLRGDKVWADNECIKMYGLLADLFSNHCDNRTKIFLKPHPADQNRENYKKYLNNIHYINHQFPSEFLSIIPDINFNAAVTVSSTSINAVDKFSRTGYSINHFDLFYKVIQRVYMCLFIIRKLEYSSFHFGIFNEIMLPLLEQNREVLPGESKWMEVDKAIMCNHGALILNDYLWRENQQRTGLSKLAKQPYSSVIFIITEDINSFLKENEDLNYIKYIFRLSLKIRPFMKTILFEGRKDSVYVFCRNDEIKQKIINTDYVDFYPVCGILCEKENPSEADSIEVYSNIYANYICRQKINPNNLLSKKYKILLFSRDWNCDRAICYLNRWIDTNQIEIVGVTSDKLTAFKNWNLYRFMSVSETLDMEYDYVIACDFSDECSLKPEMISLGYQPDKIIKGKILENPCFDFDKYRKVHKIPGGGISIISEHCFGGITYHDLDMEFNSPLINMFLLHNDFFRLVSNLKYYFSIPLEFKEMQEEKKYPIGLLGDLSLYFNHYKTFEDAKRAWEKRVKRVNFDNILVQAPLYTYEHVREFQKIPYRKIGFSKVEVADEDIIYLREFEDPYINEKSKDHFWEYVLDTSFRNAHKKFPRIYDPYKLLLGEADYLLKQ